MATREEIENLWRETYQGLTSDQRRLADDITTRSETIANRTREWATELEELTRLLAGTPCKSDVALFWIERRTPAGALSRARNAAKEVRVAYGAPVHRSPQASQSSRARRRSMLTAARG